MSQEEDVLDLVQALENAYQHFIKQSEPVLASKFGDRRFVGVTSDQSSNLDLAHLRRTICRTCGPQSSTAKILQIVGDSGTAFDNATIQSAQQALARSIEHGVFLEYGFTSFEHDANWLVQDYLSTRSETAVRAVANVVDESLNVLQSPQWTASEYVDVFVMLYNRDGTPTRFGEDTWVSDGIMSGELGDRMLCFEGGPQAFHQCVNALLAGIEVLVMTDLRPTSVEQRFSAARLLLTYSTTEDGVESDQPVKACLDRYPPKTEEQLLAVHKDLSRLRAASTAVARLIRLM